MATATEAKATVEKTGRWQVSLADLSVLVLAAGLAAGITRGARNVWGPWTSPWSASNGISIARPAGVVIVIAAVALATVLARGVVAVARGRQAGPDSSRSRILVSLVWRGLAIGLLMSFAMREAWILRVDPLTLDARMSGEAGWLRWYEVRETLSPVCMILAMIGLATGMGACPFFARPGPRRRRPYWLFVPLAGLVALLVVSQSASWLPLISQLVLVALEAVNNAMRPEFRSTTAGMSERLLLAGVEAIPAAVACLWLALVVGYDFERTRRDEPWAVARWSWTIRIVVLMTTLAAGAFVGLVAVRTMQPHLLHGFRKILDAEIVLSAMAGFGTFSAGLAARTLVPPLAVDRPRRMAALPRVAGFGLAVIVILSAFHCLPDSSQFGPGVPKIIGWACDLARGIPAWLWSVLPDSGQINIPGWLDPDRLGWVLATAAVALLVFEVALPGLIQGQPVPFDAVAVSPGRLARFAWLAVALTSVCLVAVPTLLVLGQVIVHIRINFHDWMANGWPWPF